MKALEDSVRSIEMGGLVWGASKLVPIGYGIRKLQITLVVGSSLIFSVVQELISRGHAEDELVSLDDLQDKIAEFEDYIQSSDVAAMQSKRWRFHCIEHELIPSSRAVRILRGQVVAVCEMKL
jgi:elongation factor 1-beta